MKCPVDNATLVMAERSGIEIDYCPECRGIWLDRGELDKIMERASGGEAPVQRAEDHSHDRRDEQRHGDKQKRRGSFIGDVFGGFGDD